MRLRRSTKAARAIYDMKRDKYQYKTVYGLTEEQQCLVVRDLHPQQCGACFAGDCA